VSALGQTGGPPSGRVKVSVMLWPGATHEERLTVKLEEGPSTSSNCIPEACAGSCKRQRGSQCARAARALFWVIAADNPTVMHCPTAPPTTTGWWHNGAASVRAKKACWYFPGNMSTYVRSWTVRGMLEMTVVPHSSSRIVHGWTPDLPRAALLYPWLRRLE
jgi:hypothetical protein